MNESRHFADAVQRGDPLLEPTNDQHPPMHLEKVAGLHEACSVLTGTNWEGPMTDEIEIPRSFPRGGDVTGKRVVITGASRGLGRLLAHAFSAGGASVALVARSEADLKTIAAELPGTSLVQAGDVTDADFNDAVADATVAEWGGVDAW